MPEKHSIRMVERLRGSILMKGFSLADDSTPSDPQVDFHEKEVSKDKIQAGKRPMGSIPAMRVLKKKQKRNF